MLEKPDIAGAKIITCLRDAYALNVSRVDFLPLGADRNTAVYRATTGGAAWFVRLRSGDFNEATIRVPKRLREQGVRQVIAPVSTTDAQLWTDLGDFRLTVFPFIEGRDGYEIDLLEHHWVELGRALKAIHTAEMPPEWTNRIPRETYSDYWRASVRRFQHMAEDSAFSDPVAAELAAFLKAKRAVVDELVRRAENFAAVLQTRPQPFVLCHADIHAGNVLIDSNSRLYVVDWDTLILAPKERDLMFIGGGLFANRRSPQEETALFYQGYGAASVDAPTLAYYRCERIVQDIAAYCEQLLLTDEGGADRKNGFRQLTGQFQANGVIDIAFRSDTSLPQPFRTRE